MHSFTAGGSLSNSLAGTAADGVMKIGWWQTERVALYYTGPTTSEGANSRVEEKRDGGFQQARDNSYAIAMDFL